LLGKTAQWNTRINERTSRVIQVPLLLLPQKGEAQRRSNEQMTIMRGEGGGGEGALVTAQGKLPPPDPSGNCGIKTGEIVLKIQLGTKSLGTGGVKNNNLLGGAVQG